MRLFLPTDCVSFALRSIFQLALELLLCTLSSQLVSITAYTFIRGLPSILLACLNCTLSSAARRNRQIPKFSHVYNYMLKVLRWLPIRQRMNKERCRLIGVAVPAGLRSDLPS